MKLFYRISIFINIVFACYILVKGSELLTKDLIGAKNVRNAQQSYYKKQSADLEKLDDTVITGGNFSKTKQAAWMKTVFRRMARCRKAQHRMWMKKRRRLRQVCRR